ncbi:MAG: twin-arginine translocation signal domain-containing protein [Chloroflexi bacterium]|nr:twin-arginine translocation signal domain-containing protein [Chloroflexota bacterium]
MSRLSRRDFLRTSALVAVGTAVAACAQPTAQIIEKEVPVEKIVKETVVVEKQVAVEKVVKETVVVEKQVAVEKVVTATPIPAKFHEAPMLAELVKAGKLPPVEDRLPENPSVCPLMEGVGKYGGTLRRGFNGVSDRVGPQKVSQKSLVWYNADLSLRPEVAEKWEVNADGSQWTISLRKGMKWSDGHAFTSADSKWWYENVIKNKTLTAAVPTAYSTGTPKVLAEFTYPDDYTIVIKFANPNPLFAYSVLTGNYPYVPSHYLAQFHGDLVSDKAALDKLVKEKGFNSWDQLYTNQNTWQLNPECPTHNAWIPTTSMTEELFVMERNPYFFQVDSEGNQLPYIDKVVHRLFSSVDVFNMWIIGGEIDYQQRHVAVGNFTLLKENEAKGGYRVQINADDATHGMALNHTCKNPLIREFFNNRDVRHAISLGIDRTQVKELVYDGMVTERQYSPPSQSPQYYEKLTTSYIEYDPKTANELLDKAGYDKKGADGIRLWKDGSGPISIIAETYTLGLEDQAEIVVKNMADLGLKFTYNFVERSLGEQRGRANDVEIEYHSWSRAILPFVDPAFFLAKAQDKSWCKAWTLWFNNPTDPNAEEPPADHFLRKMWALWDQIAVIADEKKQTELLFQIFDILAEEIPMPGVIGELPAPTIVKDGLRGLDPKFVMPISNPTYHGCLIPLQSYYWDEPEKHV